MLIRILGNCSPTPLLTQHFARSEKLRLDVGFWNGWVSTFPESQHCCRKIRTSKVQFPFCFLSVEFSSSSQPKFLTCKKVHNQFQRDQQNYSSALLFDVFLFHVGHPISNFSVGCSLRLRSDSNEKYMFFFSLLQVVFSQR